MTGKVLLGLTFAVATTGIAAEVTAETLEEKVSRLEALVENQADRIHTLEAEKGEDWINERRAEEVKTLVREVLSDAETRSALMDASLTAGHNGNNFYLSSGDGNFLLNVAGQTQFRYVYNQSEFHNLVHDSDTTSDSTIFPDDLEGFQTRRTKLRFFGHIHNPNLTYAVQGNFDYGYSSLEDGDELNQVFGEFFLEDAWVAYDFADGWNVKAGQFKAPFLREELVDSKHQLAVERSYTADYFTVDFTQGIQVTWQGAILDTPTRVAGMIHDGSYQSNSDYYYDGTDFAVAARGEVLLDGEWRQFDDFRSHSQDELGILLGLAVDYELGEGGSNTATYTALKWTADASIEIPEFQGLTLFFAYIGQDLDPNQHTFAGGPGGSTGPLIGGATQHAFVAQAGIDVIPDKADVFFRYEHTYFDGVFFTARDLTGHKEVDFPPTEQDDLNHVVGEESVNIITFGTNYYFYDHSAKLTVDAMFVLDELGYGMAMPGQGLLEGESGQYTLRAQLQLLF